VMNIIDMSSPVIFISNRVLPVSALPERVFALGVRDEGNTLPDKRESELTLDRFPAPRKVRVTWGQCPYGMQVIGQYNDCLNRKRLLSTNFSKGRPQEVNMQRQPLCPTIG